MVNGKTDIAYEYIKKKIINWEIPPLTNLSEEQFQKELGFSRTPIREAILRLGKEGFVYVFPRRAMIVSEVTKDLIEEIYEARLLNEPHITVKASQNISKEWLEDMKKRLTNPPEGLNESELRTYYMELDWELHISILEKCENRFLISEMKMVHDHNQRIRLKVSKPGMDNSVDEHIAILDAMKSGDKEAIRNAAYVHVLRSKKISYDTM